MSPQELATRRGNLIEAGIPWRSNYAIFKCARRINSGAAYFAAARYLEALSTRTTYPQAVECLWKQARACHKWYRKCAAEAW